MKSSIVLAATLAIFTATQVARADSEPPRTELRTTSAALATLSIIGTPTGVALATSDDMSWGSRFVGIGLAGFGIMAGTSAVSVFAASFAPPSAKVPFIVSGAVALALGTVAACLSTFIRDNNTLTIGTSVAGASLAGAGAGLFTSGLAF